MDNMASVSYCLSLEPLVLLEHVLRNHKPLAIETGQPFKILSRPGDGRAAKLVTERDHLDDIYLERPQFVERTRELRRQVVVEQKSQAASCVSKATAA